MIVLTEDQACIDDLLLGPGTPYQILGLTASNPPDVRTNDYVVPGQHGRGFAPSDTYDGKTVAGRVLVVTQDPLAAPLGLGKAAARANLNSLLVSMGLYDLNTQDKEFGMWLGGELDSTRLVGRFRLVSVDDSTIKYGYSIVTFTFSSGSEYRESSSENSLTIALPVASGGRTYPRVYPLVYGSIGSPGVGTVLNMGDVSVYPRMRINGNANGVTDPSIVNINQGRTLKFVGLTIPAGSYLEIDNRAATALLDGTASRLDKMTISQWFNLNPGNTDVQFTANTILTGATLDVFWRDGFV